MRIVIFVIDTGFGSPVRLQIYGRSFGHGCFDHCISTDYAFIQILAWMHEVYTCHDIRWHRTRGTGTKRCHNIKCKYARLCVCVCAISWNVRNIWVMDFALL